MLASLGLETNPSRWIFNGWTNMPRSQIKAHMDSLWMACPKQWDISQIPSNCNVQAYLATQSLWEIFQAKDALDDAMLNKLVQNLKLLTLTYQHIKKEECEPMFMDWWNNKYNWWNWKREHFNYKEHNRWFV